MGSSLYPISKRLMTQVCNQITQILLFSHLSVFPDVPAEDMKQIVCVFYILSRQFKLNLQIYLLT